MTIQHAHFQGKSSDKNNIYQLNGEKWKLFVTVVSLCPVCEKMLNTWPKKSYQFVESVGVGGWGIG